MSRIVAIGGGEIGRPGFPIETTLIDKEIIRLTNKKNPHLLFIPTASHDSQLYVDTVVEHFDKRLGCKVMVLRLYDGLTTDEVKKKIDVADIIYVGGGNTLKMMNKWRELGVDELLVSVHNKDKVLAGVSAGAICWFENGLSDSRSFTYQGKKWDFIKVAGLGLYDFLLCPHYSAEPKRQAALKHAIHASSKVAVALDDCVALEIVDDKFRIIKSNSAGKAYKVYWKKGQYYKEEIKSTNDFALLESMLSR